MGIKRKSENAEKSVKLQKFDLSDDDEVPMECERTAIISAIYAGNLALVKNLVQDDGADVDETPKSGISPLYAATICCDCNLEIIQFLIHNRADVDEPSGPNDYTPLFSAANNGHLGAVKILLEYGANINRYDNEEEWTPLYVAIFSGHLEIVKFLIENGADVNGGKWKPLHAVIENGVRKFTSQHKDIINLLVSKGADLSASCTPHDESPLQVAVQQGRLDQIRHLISIGADPNNLNSNNETILRLAVDYLKLDIVIWVLKHAVKNNINVNKKDNNGKSALDIAYESYYDQDSVWYKNLDLVKIITLLLSYGANPESHSRFDKRRVPLHVAVQYNHLGLVKLLLKKGLEDTNVIEKGRSALHIAVTNRNFEIVKLLLRYGADVNEICHGRQTLVIASSYGDLEIVKLLVDHDAVINLIGDSDSYQKKIALHVAAENGHLEVVKFLLEKDAQVDIQTCTGSTPLHLAVENGHLDIVKLILDKNSPSLSFLKNYYGYNLLQLCRDVKMAKILIENDFRFQVQLFSSLGKSAFNMMWTPGIHYLYSNKSRAMAKYTLVLFSKSIPLPKTAVFVIIAYVLIGQRELNNK
jgi:ankyrin repeat protein